MNLILVLLITVVLFSCSKDMNDDVTLEDQHVTLEKTVLTTTRNNDNTSINETQLLNEMTTMASKLAVISGNEASDIRLNNSRSPYYAANSGSLNKFYTNPANTSDPLNYATRRGTTQWVALQIPSYEFFYSATDPVYPTSGTALLSIDLDGVGQKLLLNIVVNPGSPTVIKPRTTANLHSRSNPNTSFSISNDNAPLDIIVHANTNGWMWVQIKKSDAVVFDSLYRYDYDSGLNNANGGKIAIVGLGNLFYHPVRWQEYTYYGGYLDYEGFCGWF